jgi:ankyrin repeat protein
MTEQLNCNFDKDGMTALHIAAKSGRADVVRCLLKSSVNIQLLNKV